MFFFYPVSVHQTEAVFNDPPTSLWRVAGKSDKYTNTHRGRRWDETQIAQLSCVQRRSVADAISTLVACKQKLDKFRKYLRLMGRIHSKPALLWAIYHFLVLIMTDWLSKLIWMMRNLTCSSKICFINVIMATDLIKCRKQNWSIQSKCPDFDICRQQLIK